LHAGRGIEGRKSGQTFVRHVAQRGIGVRGQYFSEGGHAAEVARVEIVHNLDIVDECRAATEIPADVAWPRDGRMLGSRTTSLVMMPPTVCSGYWKPPPLVRIP
jgi:hypothetical protein